MMAGRSYERTPEIRAKNSIALMGRRLSQETRAKLSAAKRGKPKSAEHRAKIGASLAGRVITVETRAKLSRAMAGNRNGLESPRALGYKHSPETCAKRSVAMMGNTLGVGRKGAVWTPEMRARNSAAMQAPLGTTRQRKEGYVIVKVAQPDAWQRRARVVAGLAPGDGLIAHHKDEDKANDSRENLHVYDSLGAHMRHHNQGRKARG